MIRLPPRSTRTDTLSLHDALPIYGRGERGDDGPRFLMLAELEGDCSADHRLLPFKRRGEAARPGAPFIGGAVEHRLDGGLHIAGKAFVRTEEGVQRPLDPKPLLVPETAHGRARRQPQRHFGPQIAQVIGTARPLHRAPAPVPDRAKAPADAGAARYRPAAPRAGDGPIGAAVAADTGDEGGEGQ